MTYQEAMYFKRKELMMGSALGEIEGSPAFTTRPRGMSI